MGTSAETELKFLREQLKAIEVGEKKISELLKEMRETGFQGRRLGEVVDVWEKMLQAKDVVIIFGYAGSMSTTGQWKIVKWLVEKRFVDVIVSTGANISEDLIEGMGFKYWKGAPTVNDEQLRRAGIYRFYDVFVREKDYIEMEKTVAEFMLTLERKRKYSSAEFLYLLGGWLSARGVDGIVPTCYEANVPVFVPALVDSGYGVAYLFNKYRDPSFDLTIDQFKDFEQLVRIKSHCKESGVVYIGGGVPKDFIQLSAVVVDTLLSGDLYTARPHKYSIQITTDSPHWGGLSGATFEEAESWGKQSYEGFNVQCYCDATIALPLVVHALAERVKKRESFPDLSWVFSETVNLSGRST